MATKIRPVREIIANAIYDDGTLENRDVAVWADLSDERKAGWMEDADRVLRALYKEANHSFAEFAYRLNCADWLAMEPDDVWREFMAASLKQREMPMMPCNNDDGDVMCSGCDCWKSAREYCG